MTASRIQTPKEFFDCVVTPDVNELAGNPNNLRQAYHACISLLSLRDWVVLTYRRSAWTYNGIAQTPFVKTRDLQSSLASINDVVNITTDIANASKHMLLDPTRRNTALHGNANTVVQTIHGGALASGPLATTPLAGSRSAIVVKIDADYYQVIECVNAVHSLWTELFKENSW